MIKQQQPVFGNADDDQSLTLGEPKDSLAFQFLNTVKLNLPETKQEGLDLF